MVSAMFVDFLALFGATAILSDGGIKLRAKFTVLTYPSIATTKDKTLELTDSYKIELGVLLESTSIPLSSYFLDYLKKKHTFSLKIGVIVNCNP